MPTDAVQASGLPEAASVDAGAFSGPSDGAAGAAGAATQGAAPPALTRRQRLGRAARRTARWSAWSIFGLILLIGLIGGGIWYWSARDQSLATVLRIIQGYMPATMTLQAEGVSGTVRQGGHIDRLIWTRQGTDEGGYTGGELVVTLDDVDVAWELAALWNRATRFSKVDVRTATLQDTRIAKPLTAPKEPLQSFTLPVSVELPFRIDTLRIVGRPQAEDIKYQSPEEAAAKASAAKRAQDHQEQASERKRLQAPAVSGSAATPAELVASAAGLAASAARGEALATSDTEISGPAAAQDTVITHLRGRYDYDRVTAQHSLRLDSLTVANGTYEADARIDGKAPMRADISAKGLLELPASATMPAQRLQASAQIRGTLAGPDALLDVDATVVPLQVIPVAGGAASASAGTRLQLQAGIHPWKTQPLARARAQWQQLDVQAFWPSAPRTRLHGALALEPVATGNTPALPPAQAASRSQARQDAASVPRTATAAASSSAPDQAPGMLGFLGDQHWKAWIQTSNDDSGAWDKGLLPLSQLDAELHYQRGTLDIRRLLLAQGRNGGALQGQGRYLPEQGWTGDVTVNHLNPGLIDTRFAAAPISGTLKATSDLGAGQAVAQAPIDFTILLRSDGGSKGKAARAAKGLAVDVIDVQGRWQNETLTLPRLLARSHDAELKGIGSYAIATQAAQADLQLALPGTSGNVKGTLSETSGQGQLQLAVGNLQQTLNWLQQWPGTEGLRGQIASGSIRLNGNWRGGWQNNGRNLHLNALLDAPAITLNTAGKPAESATYLRNTRLSVNGTLANAALDGRSEMQQGTRDMTVALRGSGGKLANGWQANLQATQLQLRDTLQNKAWQAALANPVQIRLQQSGSTLQASTSAFRIDLTGSVPGSAQILAEPIRYVQSGGGYTLSSKGRLSDVPLEWVDALMSSSISGSGLTGDLMLGGNWDVQLGNAMRINATLERSQGDLIVQADGMGGRGRVQAGIRTARLDVTGSGGAIQTKFTWDSSNAGTANAVVNTRLARAGGGWTLPDSAPLSGSLQANLPRMGLWSVFAPPGWRLRGTLQADTTLGGTLRAPLVHGTLNADDLGVRSVVDGIEFSRGRLRTRLSGQRLDIDEFSLQGPSVNRRAGGSASITGHVQWGGGGSLLQSMRMDLTAQLRELQLSSMPERQIVLSGNISTQLANLRLVMRGGLKVDHALIELSTDTAPKLDKDVVILPSRRHPKAALAQPEQAAQAAAVADGSDIVIRPSRSGTGTPAPTSPAATVSNSGTRSSGTQTAKPATGSRTGSGKTAGTKPSLTPEARAVLQDPRVKAGTARTNATITPDINIDIDLGDDLRVRGRGLDTRLRGKLTVVNGPTLQSMPRLTGTIRTDRGTFRAYGQDLQVERGRITFNGALDNPTLDIIAIRPHLDELRVGVHVHGTAQLPWVQLFSEPAMPDSEKLSWLVLGRSSAGAADAALLQQAALALLSGSGRGITGELADALGLDELSFKGGENGVASGSVTLGKRFSRNFYVAYERGLDATMGTLYFFYDISRRLKLRGETGTESAIDLIYTISYD